MQALNHEWDETHAPHLLKRCGRNEFFSQDTFWAELWRVSGLSPNRK
jgi:hypothetical protein